ncbi:MAG: hypothetical protein JJ902_03820 [Roseibium sp.]|nr:hypothetical protein [Roseibium sp.]
MPKDTIEYDFWLTFDHSGRTPRLTRNAPGLSIAERAMKCSVELPKAVFNQPQLVANIRVEREVEQELTIDIEAAETALTGVVGCDVLMDVHYPNEGADECEDQTA